ncbi:DUF6233 domain-containing protein [Streptomyces sp. NPDC059564]
MTGGLWAAGLSGKPASTDLARRALAEGVQACPHCRPDAALRVPE